MNAYDACRHLVKTWPDRWIGSPGERAAADWAEARFRKLGLDTRRLWFDCPAWDYESTELIVDGQRIEAGAQMFSPACDLTGELAAVRCDRKGGFTGDVKGRIALIREAETGGVLSRSALARALREAGALAAVIVSVLPETWSTKIFRDPESDFSSVGVSRGTGDFLLRETGTTARLRIDANPRNGKTSDVIAQNVPADDPVIIVCAHIDAAPYCPGAFDNAAGCGIVMELSERFSRMNDAPGLRFCLFGGHEFGGNDLCGFGSKSYVRDYPAELVSVRMVLNFDGCGTPDSHPHLDVWGGDALHEKVKRLASTLDGVTVGHIPEGTGGADIGAFRRAGIECVWLRSKPHRDRPDATYHSPLDDLRGIDQTALARCAEAALRFSRETI